MKDFGILRNGGFSKPQLLKACGAFGVIMSLTFLALYYGAKAYVIERAERDIKDMLLEQKGIHQYVQKIMHPALYRYQSEGEIPKSFYAPELFSSSFIVRNQHMFCNEEREQQGLPPLYYKMAANNPRNPVNLADPMESKVIAMFNADRAITTYREILDLDGTNYLFVALPFLANNQACLKCHGKREDAPLQLQALYPGQGGFDEKEGDIRSIISIRMPLQDEYAFSLVFALSLLAGMMTMTVLAFFNSRLRRVVSNRTSSLEMEIDERKRAEEQTALSFERFKAVLDSMDALVYVADMEDHKILLANKFATDSLGDIAGQTCWKVLQKNKDGPCSFCTNKFLLNENKDPTGIHVWEFRNTINEEWYECRDQAIRWTDGRLVRMEIATNITERKHMHQALAEEKELLAVTLRSIGDGVIATNTMGGIVLVNKAAEGLTGWESEQAIGRSLSGVFDIIDEVTRQAWESPLEEILKTGKIVKLSERVILISKTGVERNIAFSASPIRDVNSRVIGMVLAFRDITERLRTEQELIKVKKLESIGVLAGGIAHDFNNILAAILGNIDFALSLSDTNLSGESRQLLDEAVKASLRAQGLTQQLLTFAKGGEPIKITASLSDVITESANFILHGDRVACRYSIPDDLWLVEIDKGQISQVVQNIILNAVQAMPGGGFIDVSCENLTVGDTCLGSPGNHRFVKMTIKDRGIGIPVNILDRIFDPYFSTKQKGSGLGLAITHSIITKHGGFISAESNPGNGTTFIVHLPASEQGIAAASEKGEEMAVGRQAARILVMDDEEPVRNMTRRMLNKVGHEVILAKDGADAVQRYKDAFAEDFPFDLVILDLTVPGGMGGKEAVKEILAIDPRARVIVSSGYSIDPVMAEYSKFGFSGSLAKPFQLSDLKRVLRAAFVEKARSRP